MGTKRKIIGLSFLQVLLILSIGCKTSYQPVKSHFENLSVQAIQDTIGYSVTERYLAPYRKKLQDSFSTTIANTTANLVKRRPGGSLGNLVTASIWDYILSTPVSDETAPVPSFLIMNYGGIRLKEIPKGAITIGKIYELLPFENTLVKVSISGNDLVSLVNGIDKNGGWPMRWDEGLGTLLEWNKIKKVELYTNNYIAQGGDNCAILKNLPQEDTGILLRDIVIDYLRNKKTIAPDNMDYTLK